MGMCTDNVVRDDIWIKNGIREKTSIDKDSREMKDIDNDSREMNGIDKGSKGSSGIDNTGKGNRVLFHREGFEVRMKKACINTVSHGSFLMDHFTGNEDLLKTSVPDQDKTGGDVSIADMPDILHARAQQAVFSLKKISAGGGDAALFRVKAGFAVPEDGNGNCFSMPDQNGLEMHLTISMHGAENSSILMPEQKENHSISNPEQKENRVSYMAVRQHKTWWMRPCFPTRIPDIPARTQLLICRAEGKKNFLVVMATCADHSRTDIAGTDEGVCVTVSTNQANSTELNEAVFACGEGPDPYALIDEIYKVLRKNRHAGFKLRKEKEYPPMFRYLGWCTWDSLGQNVTEEAIFRKMEEFREKQIPVKWVLIDDGWSWVDPVQKKLKSFYADPEKFPNGLAHTVTRLKTEYGVEAVGVWQAAKGYWCGVAEDFAEWQLAGSFLQKYGNDEITIRPEAAASFGFWDAWHSILEKEGIDFVKIDGQSSLQILQKGRASYGEGLRAFYKGMEASVFLHFGGKVMNCMGMAPESVMNRSATALSRTSDDYLPTISGSFYEHALQNAYNNVYQGSLYYGDWDMFWSEHEDADKSILLRMISGGPVYISDGCGHTDAGCISRIMYADGQLRMCDDIGRPTLDCLTKDPFAEGMEEDSQKPAEADAARTEEDFQTPAEADERKTHGILKIYNRRGDTIVIACFAGENGGSGTVVPSDIPGIGEGQYIVLNTKTKKTVLCAEQHPYRFDMTAREGLVLELTRM